MEEQDEPVVDNKLIHKGVLHKLVNNGGSIALNRNFGLRLVYNEENPNDPFVELRLFAIPIGKKYKGNINPSLARSQKKKEKESKIPEIEEHEEETL